MRAQVLGHPYQELMPPPEHPADAPKGQSTGELYTQLLGSAVTYLGYSSGICERLLPSSLSSQSSPCGMQQLV